jgi:hypothetical protein
VIVSRQLVDERDAGNTRLRFQSSAQLLERAAEPRAERGGRLGCRRFLLRIVDAESDAKVLRRLEAGVPRLDALDLAVHQHHDRRKHHGERDLRDDDPRPYAAEAHATAARGSGAQLRSESAGDLSRRYYPGHYRAEDCERQRVENGRRRQIEIPPERERLQLQTGLEVGRAQPRQRELRPGKADHHREAGQHQRLGKELHHDAPPGRAESAANENLRLPCRGAREQEQRHGAAHHHHEHGGEEVAQPLYPQHLAAVDILLRVGQHVRL